MNIKPDIENQPAFKCPHCEKEIHLTHTTFIPEKQTLHLKIESKTGHFTAKTVSGVMGEFDKLMKAIAKDTGGKVEVFVDSVEQTPTSLDMGFLITNVGGYAKAQSKKPKAP